MFKAWHKDLKEMFNVTALKFNFESENGVMATGYSANSFDVDIMPEHLILLPYSGLSTFMFERVYCGHIIEFNKNLFSPDQGRKRDVVIFKDGAFKLGLTNLSTVIEEHRFEALVVGNIYEHKYLLDEN